MSKRIVIDPITRIEGHLRIEATLDDEGVIRDAFSSGTMVRGIEIILKGRDPREAWSFTQRVCGVCTTTHALASVRTVENALDIQVPKNAELIRNIMLSTILVHDHVVHFYHLHALDWVDIVSALKADPNETASIQKSISRHPKSSPAYFADVQKRLQDFVASGQLGIFQNGYWGHSAMKLPPAVNLLAATHYLEALEFQKELVKIHAIFGGKNPHPNYLVGGVPCSINLSEVNAINTERLNHVKSLIDMAHDFVNNVYMPDLLAIAGFYKEDWTKIGGGVTNYLAYGDLPTTSYNDFDSFKLPRGIVLDRDITKIHEIKPKDHEQIKEYISHAYYEYSGGDDQGLHPFEGETKFNYTGPKPPFDYLNVEEKYSWIKTPRWNDKPMEVGPLARMVVGYSQSQEMKAEIDSALQALDAPVEALFSTLGRTAARGIEAKLAANWLLDFYNDLIANIQRGDTSTHLGAMWEPSEWPKACEGVGMTEAPRGALAHWIKIKDTKIDNYQLVVPTTWNASPRDKNGVRSAYEEALIGTRLANPDQPLEILRTIHSFDPCLACSVHLYDSSGKHVTRVQAVQA